MKLIYIANFRMPTEKAHGYQVAKMCESFATQSHRSYADYERGNNADKIEIELIIPTRRNEIKADLFEYYGIERNFKVMQILTPDFIAMTPLFLRKIGFILQSIFFLIKLLTVKSSADSVIYSRNPEIVFLFSRRGYKTVFESHRWPQSKIWLHKYFIKKAVKVIAVTNTLAELYKKCRLPAGRQGFKESDILVARDGVDLKIFDINISKEDARAKLGLPQNAVLLGYTGATHTMGMGKGLEDMTEAVAEILKSRQNVFLVSVGGNKTYTEGNNLFIERVPRAKLALYQKAFDVLLMPFPKTTHYSYYMSPMKMFEYMASKRPIISSDLPSTREVLNEGNSVLVEAGNPKALAEGIKKVLDDPALAQKISAQAHEDSKKYTWDKRTENILKFL